MPENEIFINNFVVFTIITCFNIGLNNKPKGVGDDNVVVGRWENEGRTQRRGGGLSNNQGWKGTGESMQINKNQ